MSVLENIFVQEFLDDMVAVGLQKWAVWTLAMAVITYGLRGVSVIPYGTLIGGILTANLLFATVVTAYWQYIGREKYGTSSILDVADRVRGREQ